jgi:hypothetical protein
LRTWAELIYRPTRAGADVVKLVARTKVDLLLRERIVLDSYTVPQFAERIGKDEYTVREWCRFRRINATKRPTGRGQTKDWAISHAELARYRNEGLLPDLRLGRP